MPFKKGHNVNSGRKQTKEHILNVHKSVIAKRIKKICKQCNSEFAVPKCRINTIFCSKSCYSSSMIGTPTWNKKLKGYKCAKRPGVMPKGENHWSYKKDRTQLQRYNDDSKDRRSSVYNNWRKEVWSRDNFKCKIDNEDCKGRLEAHHILGYTDHPELRYDINNGITLCHFHHPRVREEEKRLIPTFKELVSVSNILF